MPTHEYYNLTVRYNNSFKFFIYVFTQKSKGQLWSNYEKKAVP
jgi:hypothetical protein